MKFCFLSFILLLARTAEAGPELRPMDREIVGQAPEYRMRLEKLPETREEERELAWKIVEEVTRKTKLGVPAFQTWYGIDDLTRVFKDAVKQAQGDTVILDWNHRPASSFPSWQPSVFAERRVAFTEQKKFATSLGFDQRVLLSPILASHLLSNHKTITDCISRPQVAVPEGLEDWESGENFAPCMGKEAPVGSAIIKARWVPVEMKVPLVKTDHSSIMEQIETGTWKSESSRSIPKEKIHWGEDPTTHTQKMLLSLHIAVKDARDWIWITLWWAEKPEFLGEGAPAEWKQYEMCTVSSYKMLPASSTGPMDAVLRAATGGDSWCSNPYIEVDHGNARTNCIGCHQHAGTGSTSSEIVSGSLLFPGYGRKKVRRNFPTDYLWSVNRDIGIGYMLQSVLEAREK